MQGGEGKGKGRREEGGGVGEWSHVFKFLSSVRASVKLKDAEFRMFHTLSRHALLSVS